MSSRHGITIPVRRTSPLIERAVVAAELAGTSRAQIAAQAEVHLDTVRNIVRRHSDLSAALEPVQTAYIAAGFRYTWLESLDAWRRGAESGDLTPQDRKNLAIAAGISIDKLALVQGWPVLTVQHLHEHRHNLAQVAGKLEDVARRLTTLPSQVGDIIDMA